MNSVEPSKNSKTFTGFYLAVASLSIGWLIGLSVSPVVNIIVSSVIVLLISAVTLLGNVNSNDEQKIKILGNRSSVQTLPIAILTLFIAIGASIGIYARTNEWLGQKKERNPIDSTVANTPNKVLPKEKGAGLYAITVDDCGNLSNKSGNDLRKALLNIQNNNIDSILRECKSDSCLIHLKNLLCTTKN